VQAKRRGAGRKTASDAALADAVASATRAGANMDVNPLVSAQMRTPQKALRSAPGTPLEDDASSPVPAGPISTESLLGLTQPPNAAMWGAVRSSITNTLVAQQQLQAEVARLNAELAAERAAAGAANAYAAQQAGLGMQGQQQARPNYIPVGYASNALRSSRSVAAVNNDRRSFGPTAASQY
jgi:hypothetical protein